MTERAWQVTRGWQGMVVGLSALALGATGCGSAARVPPSTATPSSPSAVMDISKLSITKCPALDLHTSVSVVSPVPVTTPPETQIQSDLALVVPCQFTSFSAGDSGGHIPEFTVVLSPLTPQGRAAVEAVAARYPQFRITLAQGMQPLFAARRQQDDVTAAIQMKIASPPVNEGWAIGVDHVGRLEVTAYAIGPSRKAEVTAAIDAVAAAADKASLDGYYVEPKVTLSSGPNPFHG